MKKIVLILFLLINGLFAQNDFLTPDKAFTTEFTETNDSLDFKITLAKEIYLYANKVKIYITKPKVMDITKDILLPKYEMYHGFQAYFDGINIKIPHSLLKEKLDSSKYKIKVKFQGCSTKGLCYAPMSKSTTIDVNTKKELIKEKKSELSTKNTKDVNQDVNETDMISNTLKNGSFFAILATFFGFGLLLSLTPCVFPMIPILSSIIVGASSNRDMTASKGLFLSLVYVLSMSLAYTIAGVFAGIFGANLQVALQNPWVLTIFAFIFVALAFSMFGYYKLELPQSLQNKINKTTDGKEKQGILGIAIMGFLSALIVGPCVAPPLAGALIYIGQTGDALLGGLALFVMSLGMGVPLLLIGIGAGKFMPKPGGWMDNVSKVFGIVMLGVAIWLLDRVLNPVVTMYLWALLLLGTAIYLKNYEHILLKLVSLVAFIYGVSLFLGAVSGESNPLKPLNKFTSSSNMAVSLNQELQFKSINNIEQLNKEIKNSTKPIMLDFYADWCVSCKELEEITFKDKKVIEKLQGFTLLRADVTENNKEHKALQKSFDIVGPPALIFWDKNKQEVNSAKIVGYKNPQEFLSIINTKL